MASLPLVANTPPTLPPPSALRQPAQPPAVEPTTGSFYSRLSPLTKGAMGVGLLAVGFALPKASASGDAALGQQVSQALTPYLAALKEATTPADFAKTLRHVANTTFLEATQQGLASPLAATTGSPEAKQAVTHALSQQLRFATTVKGDLTQALHDWWPLVDAHHHNAGARQDAARLIAEKAYLASNDTLERLTPHLQAKVTHTELTQTVAGQLTSPPASTVSHWAEKAQLPKQLIHHHQGTGHTHAHGDSCEVCDHVAHGHAAHAPTEETTGRNGFKLVSTRWQDWGKVLSGIAGVNLLSQATQSTLPAAGLAMGMVALLHPMLNGFERHRWATLPVLMPLVGANVALCNLASNATHSQLDAKTSLSETNKDRVTLASRLVLGVGAAIVSLPLYTKSYAWLGQTAPIKHVFGLKAAEEALQYGESMKHGLKGMFEQVFVNNAAITCARGCCVGSLICIQDIGELLAGIFAPKHQQKTSASPQQPAS